MTRLAVVSNRLPSVSTKGKVGEPEVPVGGLASAVVGALRCYPGSLWLGWNGRITPPGELHRRTRRHVGDVELEGLPLTQEELDDYYLGFCNETLWPLLHCFQSKVRITLRQDARYRGVQARFADALRPSLEEDDLAWVHDYHLLLLGRELRSRGWMGRTGFFLHTPWPPFELWQLLPEPEDFLDALFDFDVVGFHVPGFLDNYVYCCRRLLGATWDGTHLRVGDRVQQAAAYPVGIDPADFAPARRAAGAATRPVLGRAVGDRKVIVGVDRLDYTKGIPHRLLAYEHFLRDNPEWRGRVVYIQIAAPSRTGVPEYQELRAEVESYIGRINGELGEHDWVPVRYLYRSYSRDFLARLYRESDVALVTPLRDGMNLVAKEFVASQDPEDPGVLILSRMAGAAQALEDAMTVNPYIPSQVGAVLRAALEMPLDRRQAMHRTLLAKVHTQTAEAWGGRFLDDLEAARPATRILT